MSVWDDPETEDIDLEEATPLPENGIVSVSTGADVAIVNGLAPEKLEALTVSVVEKVVREVVPELAEKLIREKLEELLKEEN